MEFCDFFVFLSRLSVLSYRGEGGWLCVQVAIVEAIAEERRKKRRRRKKGKVEKVKKNNENEADVIEIDICGNLCCVLQIRCLNSASQDNKHKLRRLSTCNSTNPILQNFQGKESWNVSPFSPFFFFSSYLGALGVFWPSQLRAHMLALNDLTQFSNCRAITVAYDHIAVFHFSHLTNSHLQSCRLYCYWVSRSISITIAQQQKPV